ncbi:hypothetical protein [Nocardia vinacea]|nr:hypothetical protein [Nocardia vinacea]
MAVETNAINRSATRAFGRLLVSNSHSQSIGGSDELLRVNLGRVHSYT